jgi:hypothetical protein
MATIITSDTTFQEAGHDAVETTKIFTVLDTAVATHNSGTTNVQEAGHDATTKTAISAVVTKS